MERFNIRTVIEGYTQGYFLMSEGDGQPIEWYYTNSRTLIPLDQRFRYPKSLQRVLNQNRFEVRIDTAFEQVVDGCADRETTWISTELRSLYSRLHQAGWAHSFETWQGDRLAGGILGIAIRGVFIGESMFFKIPDGSKVAMVKLVEHLRSQGYGLFDAQLMNPHLERFGAFETNDETYQKLLQAALQRDCSFRV
ncbi:MULTISPECIES: leucyl/phenylalanyl-tRNA--protein transferase [Pseudanabaena]|uniref:Leucyl/phenylalanyl-tRNA--protein transferase n=2 Tax=Pseudanabaena TaxID=1152 RepID=L8MX75_9CYAN|nr:MULTISPECIES: leucyl/phenylalanyl-tRNA--protein transferase [Pseudanabaena]ELS32076.1 Leucyl/phenylalanyl-tRNA--protein transferase [Pseudanabaena biceps PCC 7429]MDG3495692.1 leucyl/phenylalanyl-tRNA--protein transferase [Pseudanabaena catenata USMAC16]